MSAQGGSKPRNPEHSHNSIAYRPNANAERQDVTTTPDVEERRAWYANLTDEQVMMYFCMGIILSDYQGAMQNERVQAMIVARFPELQKVMREGLGSTPRPTDEQMGRTKAEMHRIIRAAIAEANG